MKKEKYKILVETYFNKDEKKTYTKGSTIELTKDKAERLLKMKCIEKVKEKTKTKENKNKKNVDAIDKAINAENEKLKSEMIIGPNTPINYGDGF